MSPPPGGPGGPPTGPNAGEPDPERVLTQALRALAGGPRGSPAPGAGGLVGSRLTPAQVLLIAAIIGLLVGITAGLISLLV